MNGHIRKLSIVFLVGLIFCFASHERCVGEVARCDQVVDHYFDNAFNHLMHAWYVMDLLRKITIDPAARGPFIGGSVEHLLRMLSSIAALEACCVMNGGMRLHCAQKFEDLSWRLNGLSDAFGAACEPLKPDERVLEVVLCCARQLLNACVAPVSGESILESGVDRKASNVGPYNVFTA